MDPSWIRFFLRPANVVTSLAIVAGLACAMLAIAGLPHLAAALLVVAGLLDVLDGPVARAFPGPKEASDLGVQLDSLADALNFGFAPAILGYAGFGMASPPESALLAAFLLAVVFRLAAFNTFGLEEENGGRYYRGLPTTFAALFVPLAYCAHGLVPDTAHRWSLRILFPVLALLMVSPIRLRKPGRKAIPVAVLIAGAMIARLAWGALR